MIRAKTIMTENVIIVDESATVEAAAKLMLNKHVNSLLVTKNNKPIAVVTIHDLVEGIVNISPKAKVQDVMGKNFFIVDINTNYSYLVKKLKEEKMKIFPVVEKDKLVGIITETDIIDATRDFTRFHQIMQEVILSIFGLVTAFFLFFFSPLGQSIRKSFI